MSRIMNQQMKCDEIGYGWEKHLVKQNSEMGNKKKVQVLLSTYNGEKYLREQLDSVIKQDYPNINILIRDDGSKDFTVTILKEYAKTHSNIAYYVGENCGPCKSFFDLVKKADETADYYAFSDQDDYWETDKITRAIQCLKKEDKNLPLLYAGKPKIVDEKLKCIDNKIMNYTILPSFGNALIENICIGCTEVFNNQLHQLVVNRLPNYSYMHDWWFYLVATCFGKVIFDEEPFILYRQHSNNVLGVSVTPMKQFKTRVKRYKNNSGKIRQQVVEFQKLYAVEDKYNKKLLSEFIQIKSNIGTRIKIAFGKKICRQNWKDDLVFKLLILLGLI